ncbi:hypothetical protein TraAM80_02550 [Trypanosoma rangeli]|uniref:Uncharacterized protein n=1 Tax=Trypanosoma rangeli TaxID=5698 RepID=A0A422NTL3_TRYRA|nr:uncharacterized protein TraAM80_02550 [Trypanosoma rangeli]RNF08808.1 hypothetical protein TraAM80_02550 [Trypanosoma rangeli]|eukprot:RNF08808.1 hypothetical protein TraAM80_02550 [Trypanosoma rangeli]
MHVVSDLQRRPNKGRLNCERFVIRFYGVVTVVQLVCFLVYVTSFVIACKRTFVHSVWAPNPLELVPALQAKLQGCPFNETRRTLYAFTDVHLLLLPDNSYKIFADHAVQMYLAVFFSGFALLIGLANRCAVDVNFFGVSWRNFTFRKDVLSAIEIALISLLLRAALMANVTGALLRKYLQNCGLRSMAYLPFCSIVPLFVFISVGYFTYVVGVVMYLWNSLPKYGIMTEVETAAYDLWLRSRRSRIMEAKRAVHEAKRANMRLQCMIRSNAMPPTHPSTSHPGATENGAPMSHNAESAFLPDSTALHRPQMVNMSRCRDTVAQQHAGADLSMQSFNTPLYASNMGCPPPHAAQN